MHDKMALNLLNLQAKRGPELQMDEKRGANISTTVQIDQQPTLKQRNIQPLGRHAT